MLYTVFLYQSSSGLLIYDKNFQDISSGKMELFSSFFSAIKSFISEMVLDGSKELKNIELGDYTVIISSIQEINADLVMIADKEDHKMINKLIPKIIKILSKHEQLFLEWDGNKNAMKIIDQPLSELIMDKKKLLGEEKTLLENPEQVLKSIWNHKGDVSDQVRDNLTQERDFLINRLEKTPNIIRQLAVSEKVVELSEQLKDDVGFIHYQAECKRLRDEVKDVRLKLNYYLERIKSSLNDCVNSMGNKPLSEGDYKDTYLNLYSFSTKLKTITPDRQWEHYRELANILINKGDYDVHKISETISEVLNMSDNLEDYLKN